MIDLEMADALLAALEPDARLVLAGDRDQLASVQPGAVFGAACQVREGPIGDCGVILSRNYRQRDAGQIVAFADAVRTGAAGEGIDLSGEGPVVLRGADEEPPSETILRLSRDVAARHEPLWRRIRDAAPSREAAGLEALARDVLADYGRLGVLCALREGPLGARRVGRQIDQLAGRGGSARLVSRAAGHRAGQLARDGTVQRGDRRVPRRGRPARRRLRPRRRLARRAGTPDAAVRRCLGAHRPPVAGVGIRRRAPGARARGPSPRDPGKPLYRHYKGPVARRDLWRFRRGGVGERAPDPARRRSGSTALRASTLGLTSRRRSMP
jgi:hypothetical protein